MFIDLRWIDGRWSDGTTGGIWPYPTSPWQTWDYRWHWPYPNETVTTIIPKKKPLNKTDELLLGLSAQLDSKGFKLVIGKNNELIDSIQSIRLSNADSKTLIFYCDGDRKGAISYKINVPYGSEIEIGSITAEVIESGALVVSGLWAKKAKRVSKKRLIPVEDTRSSHTAKNGWSYDDGTHS